MYNSCKYTAVKCTAVKCTVVKYSVSARALKVDCATGGWGTVGQANSEQEIVMEKVAVDDLGDVGAASNLVWFQKL